MKILFRKLCDREWGIKLKKLDFDIENIGKTNIELLNCQIDLILRSLEFYCYTYQYIYPRHGKAECDEENLRISLVRDTYHQIAYQVTNMSSKDFMNFSIIEKNFKKIS